MTLTPSPSSDAISHVREKMNPELEKAPTEHSEVCPWEYDEPVPVQCERLESLGISKSALETMQKDQVCPWDDVEVPDVPLKVATWKFGL